MDARALINRILDKPLVKWLLMFYKLAEQGKLTNNSHSQLFIFIMCWLLFINCWFLSFFDMVALH